jgi:hypothetical protein
MAVMQYCFMVAAPCVRRSPNQMGSMTEGSLQMRHDEEAATLSKRRANFQRDRDQLTKEAETEYEEECERSTFKITILEKRLKHHEEQAICKYYELDHKLRRDPRLAVLAAHS